jgi:NTP pyrophosphatase (non-canonical NTP hydrolase)
VHNNEDWKHDAKKLAEELLELATELVKQSNKPHKDYHDKIQDELADVAYRLDKMVEWYSTEAMAQRMVDKWGGKEG